MVYFTKNYFTDVDYNLVEHDDSVGAGWKRIVPETYVVYIEWVETNTPEKVSDNKYVTITDDIVTFDATTKAADDIKRLKESLKEQRDQLLRSNEAMMTVLLYLAEDKAVAAGKITNEQRTVTGAVAINHVIYLRKLYRLLLDETDPTKVELPTAPTAVF